MEGQPEHFEEKATGREESKLTNILPTTSMGDSTGGKLSSGEHNYYDSSTLKKYLEANNNLVDYFVSYSMDNLEGFLKAYEDKGNNFLKRILSDPEASLTSPTLNETTHKYEYIGAEKFFFDNLKFCVLDRVPALDRNHSPISQVLDIIPSQLFKKSCFKIQDMDDHRVVQNKISYSSIFLPSTSSYIYMSGILFYEEIGDFTASGTNPKGDGDDFEPPRRIGIPKIICLISRIPIYKHLANFLKNILERSKRIDRVPIESMVKNLIFETRSISPFDKLINPFWKMNKLDFYDLKSDFFFTVFALTHIYKHIPKLLEKMIFGVPLILLSDDGYLRVSLTEVLKTLLFPFEFQGLILPYETKPHVKLLTSSEPFLIGMDRSTYKSVVSPLGKQCYEVYDCDNEDFVSLSSSSRIVVKLQNQSQTPKKSVDFPEDLVKTLQKNLEKKLKTFKDAFREYNQILGASRASRATFSRKEIEGTSNDFLMLKKELYKFICSNYIDFFIYKILDIKNIPNIEDYVDEKKMVQNPKRGSKLKKYRDFIAPLLKTTTYLGFAQYIVKNPKKELNDDNVLVKEYLMLLHGSKKPKYLWDFDSKEETIPIPVPMEYEDLKASYDEDGFMNPLIYEEYKGDGYYKYKFFPKLMDKFILKDECLNSLKWPDNGKASERRMTKKSLCCKIPYTKDNITVVIWTACVISSYWYHQNNEKIVHTTTLVNYLLKSIPRLHRDQRKHLLKYAIEAIRMFGDYQTIAENLNYFIQNISAYHKYKIDWQSYNILSTAFKYLDLGITYDYISCAYSEIIEEIKEDDSNYFEYKEGEEESKTNRSKIYGSIVAHVSEFNLNALSTRTRSYKSKHSNLEEQLLAKNENPMYQGIVNNVLTKHNSAMNKKKPSNPLNVFTERNKSIKNIKNSSILSNEAGDDGQETEYFFNDKPVEIRKRTFEIDSPDEQFNYFILPMSKCEECKGKLKDKGIKEYIILKDTELYNNSAVGYQTCPFCNKNTFQITLEVWRKSQIDDTKEKERIHTVSYIGPFSLLAKIQDFINKDSVNLKESGMSEADKRFAKFINEYKDNDLLKNILMLDIIKLRKENMKLFWNIVYRFIIERKDHNFILPYEIDIFPEIYEVTEVYTEEHKDTTKLPIDDEKKTEEAAKPSPNVDSKPQPNDPSKNTPPDAQQESHPAQSEESLATKEQPPHPELSAQLEPTPQEEAKEIPEDPKKSQELKVASALAEAKISIQSSETLEKTLDDIPEEIIPTEDVKIVGWEIKEKEEKEEEEDEKAHQELQSKSAESDTKEVSQSVEESKDVEKVQEPEVIKEIQKSEEPKVAQKIQKVEKPKVPKEIKKAEEPKMAEEIKKFEQPKAKNIIKPQPKIEEKVEMKIDHKARMTVDKVDTSWMDKLTRKQINDLYFPRLTTKYLDKKYHHMVKP